MDEIENDLQKLRTLNELSFVPNYKGKQETPDPLGADETFSGLEWHLPTYIIITKRGRKIVGRDPNISPPTLKSLIISDSHYISESLRERLLSSSSEQIAKEEFLCLREIGATHLAQCIKDNLNQTKADLIATYSDDRRLPFVVGAIYIEAFMKCYKPFYYCYSPDDCFIKKEWKPRKIYIQPETKLPPEKRELKKYYRANNAPVEEIMACPRCGSPAKLFRVGYRGKDSQVCCTDTNETCPWFLGDGKYSSGAEAINAWNKMCKESISDLAE